MATIDYKQLATPEANLIELLSAQNQDGTYTAKLMGSEPFAVLAAKTIYNAYNDIEDNMAADVEGPAFSTDNALARFDGTTGKLLQNSNAILTDAGALSLASNLTVSGGTIGTAASTNLTLNGGSSGASLVLGQGTNGTFTFTLPSISSGNTTWVSAGAVGIGIDFKRATATGTIGAVLASLNGYNGATRAAIFEFLGDGATDSGRFDWWVKPTAGSLTQAMVLKSTGNLLIGTTTDGGQKLQVNGDSGFLGHLEIPADKHIYMKQGNPLRWSSNGLSTGTIRADIYADSGGILYFRTNGTTAALNIDSSQNATFANHIKLGSGKVIYFDGGITTYIQGSSGALFIGTNGASSLSIDSSQNATFAGTVTTSTTNSSQNAGIGNKLISSGAVWVVNAATNDAFSYYNSSAAAYRFYVDSGGTISATNTAISAISDARLKENVRDLSGGLSSILALKPRVFDWKEGKGANKKNVRGFIAQEIEQVFPDLVDEWKDAAPEGEAPYKSVRQDLIPVLVKAIQELTARVVALENA